MAARYGETLDDDYQSISDRLAEAKRTLEALLESRHARKH